MGRGSSKSHKAPYGTEFETVYEYENIKFVRVKSGSVTAPQYTMTKGRVYATLNKKNEIKHITFNDNDNDRSKQIDVKGHTHPINGKKLELHVHTGFNHDDGGEPREANAEEIAFVDKVRKIWDTVKGRVV